MDLHFLLLFSTVALSKETNTDGLKLKQVLIFSRHNIRKPLGTGLQRYTPKILPKLDENPGYLTRKGALLEGYMGVYFSEWFKKEQFLPETCPSEYMVYVYANSVNRTVETAKAFIESAFRGCNITVNHKITNNTEEMDPNFKPVIRNNTEAFKTAVFKEINLRLDNAKLKAGLSVLNEILEFNRSEICQTKSICDLTDNSKNKILLEVGHELWVAGPLYIGSTMVDSFLMGFYDGLPIEHVAWGLVKTSDKWESITDVTRIDQYLRYGKFANDIGAPIIELFTSTFLEYNNKPKLMLIVGHDFNQISISYAMRFKQRRLPNQFENFPIGGKIVFQRWTDNQVDYLKIEYIYASWLQLRNGTKLSAEDPPQRVLLELKWCKVDRNGFCPWNEFISKLKLLF